VSDIASSDEKSLVPAKFCELKKSFSITIRAKVAEIRLSWNRLKTDPSDLATFEILYRQAHNLAGTCAIFEFESISIFSNKIELALDQAQSRCFPYNDIEQLLDELETAAGGEPTE
jgi:chemotaxis protein histidine kinase CheA